MIYVNTTGRNVTITMATKDGESVLDRIRERLVRDCRLTNAGSRIVLLPDEQIDLSPANAVGWIEE